MKYKAMEENFMLGNWGDPKHYARYRAHFLPKSEAEYIEKGFTKHWEEPTYKQVDRLSIDIVLCLIPSFIFLIYAVRYLAFGFFDSIWVELVLGVVAVAISYFTTCLLWHKAGKKSVLVTEGRWYWKQPPPKVMPIYPPYPQTDIYKPPANTVYGSAHWSDPNKIRKLFCTSQQEGDGILINATTWVGQQMHGICVAGSGQGKGVSIILPNLLSRPKASWFILDPKGENALISARWQKEAGQTVYILDPWNEQERLGATHGIKTSGCNPLSFVKGNPTEIIESCAAVAVMIAPDEGQAKDPYWNGRARALIKTYLLHLMSDRPEAEQHLGTIYDWLRCSEDERIVLWTEMKLNTAFNGAVRKGINQFYDLNTDTGPLPSIISNAQEHTEFMESEALRASLSKNDFDVYDLNNGETTVYLCLPERYLRSHAKWLRLIVCVCLKACNFRPKKRVNFFLDEFAILGKMPDVQDAYAYARGQKVCVFSFIQSLSQLFEIYGQHGAETLLACSRLRQFFGIFDLATQKYLSEYLGERTVRSISESYSETKGSSSGSSTTTSTNSGSQSEGFSFGSSKSDSTGLNWSTTRSWSKTPVGRRLLTADEVGKSNEIITLIDGRKYLLPRIPFWANYHELIKSGKIRWMPADWDEWKHYHHVLWGWEQPDEDADIVGGRFRPRADGHVVKIDDDQKQKFT